MERVKQAELIVKYVLPAAYALLPPDMRSAEASTLLVAIGYQESGFEHRRQVRGPARGFWQFEAAGVRGVLTHRSSRTHAHKALSTLGYAGDVDGTHAALEHNDVLAAVFARLLLWTLPVPIASGAAEGWRQYIEAWRPGKPHPATWAKHWASARGVHLDTVLRA